jgi:voltage-gated potassium channel
MRYSLALQTLRGAVHRKRGELVIVVSVSLMALIVASSLMYFAEHEAQPAKFSSIPQAIWWGVMALSSVGARDVYPITTRGRLVAAIIAMVGIIMFALLTGTLGTGLAEELQGRRRSAKHCPHCGREIDAVESRHGHGLVEAMISPREDTSS